MISYMVFTGFIVVSAALVAACCVAQSPWFWAADLRRIGRFIHANWKKASRHPDSLAQQRHTIGNTARSTKPSQGQGAWRTSAIEASRLAATGETESGPASMAERCIPCRGPSSRRVPRPSDPRNN
jgi:hypothetical protein